MENTCNYNIEDLPKSAFLFGYTKPTPLQLTVKEYVSPEKFAFWKDYGESIGFKYVASGPLVLPVATSVVQISIILLGFFFWNYLNFVNKYLCLARFYILFVTYIIYTLD